MTTTTQVPAVFDLSPSGSANSTSASVFSGVLDLRSALSALLTFSANVGASAPTTQCQVNVLHYHTTSATPPSAAAASTGATGWKNLYSVGSGIVANTKNPWNFRPPTGGYVCLEFTASATNTVVCEAFATVITSASSV
jgi:hypothetical protein